ncbi:Fc.00g010200.m01.CDS01 [Cosmosporella sp. VM-42]
MVPADSEVEPKAKRQCTTQSLHLSTASSIGVKDFGDTKFPAPQHKQERAQQPLGSQRLTKETIPQTGTESSNSFLLSNSIGPDGSHMSPAEALEQDIADDTLGEMLRGVMIESAPSGDHDFLPITEIESILIKDRVSQEVAKLKLVRPHQLPKTTSEILDTKEVTISTEAVRFTSRKKIFAILVLVGKVDAIRDFIDEGIYDSDLPFDYSREPNTTGGRREGRRLKRITETGEMQPINLFTKWKHEDVDAFEGQQWKVDVVIFRTCEGNSRQPPDFKLKGKSILPFTEAVELGRGGFSAVHRVKIHRGHLDGQSNQDRYAVKKLNHSDRDAFKKEVSALSRFVEHPHLIRLLWTYSWGEQYHLVFPCANGNLRDLWEEHRKPFAEEQDHQRGLWFVEQCRGIVDGLCVIHQDEGDGPREPTRPNEKRHGRHGDLKPENILWFRGHEGPHGGRGMGVLKISDFGLTRFHGTCSRSRISIEGVGGVGGVGASPTYRAPEYDVYRQVSQSYDIWSLGCVFLEFVTWYLTGWDEVDNFSKSRKDDDNSPDVAQDVFFNYIHMNNRTGAQAKKSVADEFRALYENRNASDFTIDLVTFIETKLLRMNPSSRARCPGLRETFKEFHSRCRDEPDYCLKLNKVPPSRNGTDLSLLEPFPLNLSPRMDKAVQKAHSGHLGQQDDGAWARLSTLRRSSGSFGPPPRSTSLPKVMQPPESIE